MELYCVTLLVCALLACAASLKNGDVRLQGDLHDSTRGRVEVFDGQNWTSICYDYLAPDAQKGIGQTVCRQLDYYDVLDVGNVSMFKLPEGDNTDKLANGLCDFVQDPVNAAQHIYRCYFIGGECSHGDDMAVDCESDHREDYPYDTMVDFLNDGIPFSNSLSEGFAQVYLNKMWGPVCNMNKDDANTFCTQLSFTNAVSVEERNGSLVNPALLDKFHCINYDPICLQRCFDYPGENDQISCPNGHSYVTCEFQRTSPDEFLDLYGTKSRCTSSGSNSGAVAGAVMGILLAFVVVIIAAGVLAFFLRGKIGSYTPTSTRTKYDAI